MSDKIDEAEVSFNEIKEALREELYACFDELSDDEIIKGCTVSALCGGFCAATDPTGNKLRSGARKEEIAALIVDLVEEALNRIMKVDADRKLQAHQEYRKTYPWL